MTAADTGSVPRMEALPYQIEGATWLASRRNAALFDEPGLGKTAQAILASRQLHRSSCRRILAIVPTIVLWNWEREWDMWDPGRRVQVLQRGSDCIDPSVRVVICSHGLLLSREVYRQILDLHWGIVILDEAHCFRNRAAKRTRLFYGHAGRGPSVISRSDRVWLLTGTPAPNNASELWTHLRNLAPGLITGADERPYSFHKFRDSFCEIRHTPWGAKIAGNKNVNALRNILREFSLRRTKRDVLPELPEIRFDTLLLSPARIAPKLALLERDMQKYISLPENAERLLSESPAQFFAELKRETFFAEYRRLCGMVKVDLVVQLLDAELAFGDLEKVVVYAHHADVIARLVKGLGPERCAVITGSSSAAERSASVDRFQSDPSCRVFVGNIVAAGVGVTLTAANEVVFAEMSYIPGENAQAADRCHRIGQQSYVRARFIALSCSVDEHLTRVLQIKTRMIREILKGR